MKKIMLPFNSQQMNTNLIEFGCYIASLSHSALTGIFINTHSEAGASAEAGSRHYFPAAETGTVVKKEPVKMDTDQSIRLFMDACARRGVTAEALVRGTARHNKSTPLEEVVHESRYADLLIVDTETTFNSKAESAPGFFAKEIMTQAECPVILAPAVFETINEVVFCYDGERASMFAIKQFAYLFPQLAEKKLTVLEVNDSEDRFVEKEKLQDWLHCYFAKTNFKVLEGEAEDELLNYFLLKKNVFIVMGAYGRSRVSTLLKPSSANLLIRVVDLPIFIAHK